MSGVWDHHWLYGRFFLIQRSTCSPAAGALGFAHEIQSDPKTEIAAALAHPLKPTALTEMSMFALAERG
jgi:hypothetical protein